jgi:putative ABC transport system permease protein
VPLPSAALGSGTSLKIVGIDAFRAGFVAPDLLGVPAAGRGSDVLADDALFLSPAAMAWLNVTAGASVTLRAGSADLALRVAGTIAHARSGQRLAVMDRNSAST